MAINYKNYLTSNIGTTFTTVFNPTATGAQTTVIGLFLSNNTTAPITANVTLTSGATTANVVRNAVIYAGTSLNVIDSAKLIVEQNDVVQVNCSDTGAADVIVSTVEVT